MSQYKGKREASRQEHPEKQRQGADRIERKVPVGDPFANEKPTLGERMEDLADDVASFFRSRKGKIITTVVCCILAVGIGAAVAVKSGSSHQNCPVWILSPAPVPASPSPMMCRSQMRMRL